jgi:hypothetical protein
LTTIDILGGRFLFEKDDEEKKIIETFWGS